MIKIIGVLKVRHKQIDRELDEKREIKREREKEREKQIKGKSYRERSRYKY